MQLSFKTYRLAFLSLHFLLLALGNNLKNGEKCVMLRFIDHFTMSFPEHAIPNLFVLPSDYGNSFLELKDANDNNIVSKKLPVFLVNTEKEIFMKLLKFIYNCNEKYSRMECPASKVFEATDSPFPTLRSLQLPSLKSTAPSDTLQDEDVFVRVKLKSCFSDRIFMKWLTNLVKEWTDFPSNTIINICRHWYHTIQYIFPVVLFSDIRFLKDNVMSEIDYGELIFESKIVTLSSGAFGKCYSVQLENIRGSIDKDKVVFKLFKHPAPNKPRSSSFNLVEYDIFLRSNIFNVSKLNSVFAVVTELDDEPIGYIMKKAEYGDLFSFVSSRNTPILSKYFIEQLFEVAKTINYLHQHNILHLDLKVNNILVRKRENCIEQIDDYEFILGDFGHSRKLGKDMKVNHSGANLIFYPPEMFNGRDNNTVVSASSDWYEFGKLLINLFNHIPSLSEKRDFILSFYPVGECLTRTDPSKRMGFVELSSFFSSFIQEYGKIRYCINLPVSESNLEISDSIFDLSMKRPSDECLPQECKKFKSNSGVSADENNDERQAIKLLAESLFSEVSELKSKSLANDERVQQLKQCNTFHFILTCNNYLLSNFNNWMPPLKRECSFCRVYIFVKEFPYKLQMTQTLNDIKYFHKGSCLLFYPGLFHYVSFYHAETEEFIKTISSYSHLDIVKEITTIEADCLRYFQ